MSRGRDCAIKISKCVEAILLCNLGPGPLPDILFVQCSFCCYSLCTRGWTTTNIVTKLHVNRPTGLAIGVNGAGQRPGSILGRPGPTLARSLKLTISGPTLPPAELKGFGKLEKIRPKFVDCGPKSAPNRTKATQKYSGRCPQTGTNRFRSSSGRVFPSRSKTFKNRDIAQASSPQAPWP